MIVCRYHKVDLRTITLGVPPQEVLLLLWPFFIFSIVKPWFHALMMMMKGESLTIWLFCHLSLKSIVWRCWRVTPWQYPLTRLSTTGNSFQHFQHVLCHPDPKDHVDHICYRRVSNNICPTIFALQGVQLNNVQNIGGECSPFYLTSLSGFQSSCVVIVKRFEDLLQINKYTL